MHAAQSFLNLSARFLRDVEGATAIEYSVIGALIAVAIVVGASLVGVKLNDVYSGLAAKVPEVN